MNLDRMTLARARLALREAERDYLFDPNITLIDFGIPKHEGQLAEGELAIRFHVRKKFSDFALETSHSTRCIQPMIGGFPTDVLEGTYHPHRFTGWFTGLTRPTSSPVSRAELLCGGLSISNEIYTFATLGGLVIDRTTNAEMILSNWHVLVGRWGVRQGARIYQPGRRDGGSEKDVIATLTRDAMTANLDAAVAMLNGRRKMLNEQLHLGPVTGVGQAQLGMKVVKSGRRTGVTYGHVTAIEGIARMFYDRVERIIRHVVTIEPSQAHADVSAGGDSGSWWLNAETRQAIGLHFAGSDSPERALAHDMQTVLEALNIDIAINR
ncbi:MAG: hypothetical protein ACREOI_12705 [bacterium]